MDFMKSKPLLITLLIAQCCESISLAEATSTAMPSAITEQLPEKIVESPTENSALTAPTEVPKKGIPFSVSSWGSDFKSALSSNNAEAIKNLTSFRNLEKSLASAPDKKSSLSNEVDNKTKLHKARELFAHAEFDSAIEVYNQIPRGSDYWFQAVEEKGWSFYRKGESEKAIAQSKTLLSPPFSELVSSEAYFLQSLSQLKLCDYKGIFVTHQLFKEKQKSHILEIQKLAASGMNDALQTVVEKTDALPLQGNEITESLMHLPAFYYKDLSFQAELMRFKLSQKGLNILAEESSHIEALPKSLQKSLPKNLEKINQESFEKLKTRMAALAKQEVEANHKIIQKLNLIEVEAIQRIHTDLSIKNELYSKGKFRSTNADQLIFMDDGLPWIDELDKFEVIAKSCPQNLRRKM
jgi:hypothetical protein